MQRKHLKGYVFSLLALTALLASMISMGAVFAKGSSSSHQGGRAASSSGVTVSATKGASPSVTTHSTNIFALPKETASSKLVKNPRILVLRSSSKLALAKASHNRNAPVNHAPLAVSTVTSNTSNKGFNGMADSATICPYFGGCQPPDMALATSPKYVLQGVNTSNAVYDTNGNLVVGPINDINWYGVPPLPNNCDPLGPFLSDPRAFYDPNTGLFWTAMLQVESAAFGVGVNCPNLSLFWVANLNMKTGVMHVYSFDMTLGGTVNAGADYTQLGFSGKTVALTGNMFDFTTGGFDFAESIFMDKATMEAGNPVTPVSFTGYSAFGPNGQIFLDTVQPVDTVTTPANDPGVQYLVNSFNIFGDPFGNDCFFSACQGFVTWAYNPANQTLGGTLVLSNSPNPNYLVPNNANQPGCIQCVETIDTRITGTPVYSVGGGQGLISFSLDTQVGNGGVAFPSSVPGILWGQIQVANFPGNPVVPIANLYQSGYISFAGDQAASFGALMQDKNGRTVMVFDTMSSSLNPSIMVVSRNKSAPLGTIGNARFIIKGPSATFNSRWGDFEAASYDGFNTNHIWVAAQYSISGDWATFIARV